MQTKLSFPSTRNIIDKNLSGASATQKFTSPRRIPLKAIEGGSPLISTANFGVPSPQWTNRRATKSKLACLPFKMEEAESKLPVLKKVNSSSKLHSSQMDTQATSNKGMQDAFESFVTDDSK